MPKVGTKAATVEAALLVCEYGFEHLNYTNVAARMGLTDRAVAYHWVNTGGLPALRAAVVELAKQRRNPFILGQLRAVRRLPDEKTAPRLADQLC